MNKILESIQTPMESVNDDSVIVVDIHVKDGEKVEANKILAEIETSKAIIEIVSSFDGFVKCLCKKGDEINIGETIFEIFSDKIIDEKENKTTNHKNEKTLDLKNKNSDSKFETKYSKEAEKLISEKKIDKDLFKDFNFVSTEEVLKILDPNPETNVLKEKKLTSNLKNYDEPSISFNKKTILKQKSNEIAYLSEVNSTGLVSRLTTFISADLDSISMSQNFIKSTPLPLVVYEVSRLLIKYPNLNSFYKNQEILNFENINIGIAFDNEKNGLKVGSIFDADKMTLNSIENSITDLSLKYEKNKLSLEEISSATLTITDLFSTGIINFHPLVNNNNSVIIGLCGINNGGFNIECSFDHRISNGKEISNFLNDLKYRIESRYGTENFKPESNVEKFCMKCLRGKDEDINGELYLLRAVNSKGNGYICSNCLSGY